MKKIYIGLYLLLCGGLAVINAQPCNLFGASVDVDNSTTPIMINATVGTYEYMWNNGTVGNQTRYYPSWCVSIFDYMTNCDTIICESCIADSTVNCLCISIYLL